MAATYEAIATVTVGSGGAANIEFTSIAADWTDLVIKYSLRSDQNNDYGYALLTVNSSGSNYSARILYADSNSAGSTTSLGGAGNLTVGNNSTANTFSNGEAYLPNYASSNNKSMSFDAVTEKNASTNVGLYLTASLWSDTTAITSVKLALNGAGNFVQYSTATLYGISNS